MEKSKEGKKHAAHAFSQFRLTQNLLNNLQYFDVSPIAKLVLLEISACFNPETNTMFPKQATIADKIGCSERSVIRAVQELVKAGLIIVEGKHTYKYKFSQYLLNLGGMMKVLQIDDNLSPTTCQNVTQEPDNLSPDMIEPKKEPKKEPLSVADFKILKNYAKKHNAYNEQAYIRNLINSGAAKRILADDMRLEIDNKSCEETARMNEEIRNFQGCPPPQCFKELKKKLIGGI